MSRHVVRFVEVRWTGEDGELAYARRGEVVELPDDEAARLTALGAVVAPGTDISPPVDERPWAEVLQAAADARYDRSPV